MIIPFSVSEKYFMTVRIEDWAFWENKEGSADTPELSFLPSRAKRRMSLLSRMSLHVGHSLLKKKHVNDVIFASRYGEITRQLSITNSFLDDGEVSPAEFSYSVFNTPVALLSLSEGLTGLTRAVYSGENSLIHGLLQSLVALKSGAINQLLFIMADEPVPEYYREISSESNLALAVGMTLTTQEDSRKGISLAVSNKKIRETSEENHNANLRNLLNWLKSDNAPPHVLNGEGFSLEFNRDPLE